MIILTPFITPKLSVITSNASKHEINGIYFYGYKVVAINISIIRLKVF